MKLLSLLFAIPFISMAANYSVENSVVDGIAVVRLGDAARKTVVSVAPSLGNLAYEMKVNGKNIYWMPRTLGELRAKPSMCGNPFLAPWAEPSGQRRILREWQEVHSEHRLG